MRGWGGRAMSAGRSSAGATGEAQRVSPAERAERRGRGHVEIPQVREAAEPFVSKLFPRGKRFLRTEPLKAMVIGAFVRGLSMRDAESLCDEAGLGKVSKSTASRICKELRDRLPRSGAETCMGSGSSRCSLMRSTCPSVRRAPRRACCAPGDQRDGRAGAAGGDARDARVRGGLDRLGRDLTGRGLPCPSWSSPTGPPGSTRRSSSAGQRRTVSAARSTAQEPVGKLPSASESASSRVMAGARRGDSSAMASAETRAIGEEPRSGYHAAAACLAEDLDALIVHLKYPLRHRRKWRSTDLLERSLGEVRGARR